MFVSGNQGCTHRVIGLGTMLERCATSKGKKQTAAVDFTHHSGIILSLTPDNQPTNCELFIRIKAAIYAFSLSIITPDKKSYQHTPELFVEIKINNGN